MVRRFLSGEIYVLGLTSIMANIIHHKGEIPGWIELLSYLRINGNLVPKSK